MLGCRETLALVLCAAGAASMVGCESRGKKAQQSTSILQMFAPPTPAEAAAWAVDPFDADKRARGILLLANAPWGGAPVYVELYRRALADGDSGVRAVAVRGLALHGAPEDVPRIVEQFNDPARNLRWECARALQRLHNDAAIDPLREHLEYKKEAENEVRCASAIALGQYAERKVVDSLIFALDDRDLAVTKGAQDSLTILTGHDYGDDVRAWVTWTKQAPDVFAERRQYIYPVFYRDPDWLETILPFFKPPNEIAAAPVGMDQPAPKTATP